MCVNLGNVTPGALSPASGSQARILLVEDDPEAALPVVVITSHVHLRTAALRRRADEFLTKPVRIDQLLATVTALIERAAGATGQ
jgi:FixJ family two-component response regulator